ncbi:MAG TPA: helix-turn-helix transcriptional regulator [Mycobacterium sp.]|nr:helix-turn-helix transcriptional regulator [Mycobacterium sp.]HUH70155.1 helix-turn-helix transcriptional regulator [Mycobacterium sp.]
MPEDLVFNSDDLGVTEQFLGEAYARMNLRPGDSGRTRSRVVRRWLGSVSVDQLDFSFTLSYKVRPLGRICVCRMHAGTIEENFIGEPPDVFAPGDVTILTPPDLPYSGRLSQASYDLTMFDPGLLDRVAAAAPGRRAEPVRLLGHRPVSAAAGDQLNSTITYLREHVLAVPEARNAPLIVSTAAQHLAATVLHAFPNTALREPTATDRRDATPVLLRRAIAFIEDNAHTDITVGDIAGAIYVTPRAVQYMFHRHLHTTPMAYLRRVRLHQAHVELLAADRATTTVTAVATRWGFAHTGRFAAAYRQAYGRSPHETLRQ